MGANISSGLLKTSSTSITDTQSYQKLGKLDFNGDAKLSGTELKFIAKLDELGSSPTKTQIKKLMDSLPQNEKSGGMDLILLKMLTNASPDISLDDLTNIIKKVPDEGKPYAQDVLKNVFAEDELDFYKGEALAGFDADGDKLILPEGTKKIMTQIAGRTELAKDILDGDSKVKGLTDNVTKDLLQEKTYEISTFKPQKFSFNFKSEKKVSLGDMTATVKFDKRSGGGGPPSVIGTAKAGGKPKIFGLSDVRTDLNNVTAKVGGKSVTFADYAKGQGIDLNNFDAKDLGKVKEFVSGIQNNDAKLTFVSFFMTSSFVHTGDSIDQTGVNEGNFGDMISQLPDEKGTGRKYIDCTYFSAVSKKLLSGGEEAMKSENVHVDLGGVAHDISVIRNKSNDQFYVQSNNNIHEVSIEELKKIGFDPSKGEPPTSKQIVVASEGLKKEWGGNSAEFFGNRYENESFSLGIKPEEGNTIKTNTGMKFNITKFESADNSFKAENPDGKGEIVGRYTDLETGEFDFIPAEIGAAFPKGEAQVNFSEMKPDGTVSGKFEFTLKSSGEVLKADVTAKRDATDPSIVNVSLPDGQTMKIQLN